MALIKVGFIGTNDPKNYSGGRYHGVMMANACASAGYETHFMTDHIPAFAEELSGLSLSNRVNFHESRDFQDLTATGIDFLIIIPTGIFHPEFYERSLRFAERNKAIVALLNFESGNWFNSVAPQPKDIRLWAYWQRTIARGGVCFSSLRESFRWAKGFYRAFEGHKLRHEVWPPPINSRSAEKYFDLRKDGSMVAFVRPTDNHKGSSDLLHIDRRHFAGRVLNLVAGRDVDGEYRDRIEKYVRESGGEVRIHYRINDETKYRLISQAQVLLFPSRFEGFGIPPIEAAYCGTESVCFDLPCVRETVGSISHLAATGDMQGYNSAIATALKEPPRRDRLRDAVFEIANFERASTVLGEIIARNIAILEGRTPREWSSSFGPFFKDSPRAPRELSRGESIAPFPADVVWAALSSSGEIIASVLVWLRKELEVPAAFFDQGEGQFIFVKLHSQGDWINWRADLALSPSMTGKVIRIGSEHRSPHDAEFRIDGVGASLPTLKPKLGISELRESESGVVLRGWVIANNPVDVINVTLDRRRWYSALVNVERTDVRKLNLEYPTSVVGFTINLPERPLSGTKPIVILSGRTSIVDMLSGWPPTPRPGFSQSQTTSATKSTEFVDDSLSPVPSAAESLRAKARTQSNAIISAVILSIEDVTNEHWLHGVSRTGGRGRLGAFRVPQSSSSLLVAVGDGVRLRSQIQLRITTVITHEGWLEIVVDGPVDFVRDCAPGTVELIRQDTISQLVSSFTLSGWSDKTWVNSVYNGSGADCRRGFFYRVDKPNTPKLAVGMILEFAASGQRAIVKLEQDGTVNMRVWLDDTILPIGDGRQAIRVVAPNSDFEFKNQLHVVVSSPESDANAKASLLEKRIVLRLDEVARKLRTHLILRFANGSLARVLGTGAHPLGICVEIDKNILGLEAKAGNFVSLADPARLINGFGPKYIFAGCGDVTNQPLYLELVEEARRRKRCESSPQGKQTQSRRIMMVSLVPYQPANQGNRVVTRNLLNHFVNLGYEVDLIVQNWIDHWQAISDLPKNVRTLSLPFPNWQKSESVRFRQAIGEQILRADVSSIDDSVVNELTNLASNYNPFFICSDDSVENVRALLEAHKYDALIINYTHMLRVAAELEGELALPPIAVITHDALSRLPREFAGTRLDTSYRASSIADEVRALNAVAGSTVVAISKSEQRYFSSIGVKSPIILVEFDSAREAASYALPANAFEHTRLVFHGSGNPMNVASLTWFVDNCWYEIKRRVPGASLAVCGRICDSWKLQINGIELLGELSRPAMFRELQRASVAINPCVAGTGLKIKTVEAIAMGVPSVCLPSAVEGLEDISHEIGVVANDAVGFTEGCIKLLTEKSEWTTHHEKCCALATSRFSESVVYRELDREMELSAFVRDISHIQTAINSSSVAPMESMESGTPLLGVARTHAQSGHTDAAALMLSKMDQVAAPSVASTILQARLAFADGVFWGSICHCAAAISADPVRPEGYELMASGLMELQMYSEAKPVLLQALMLDSGNQDLVRMMSMAAQKTNDAAMLKQTVDWLENSVTHRSTQITKDTPVDEVASRT